MTLRINEAKDMVPEGISSDQSFLRVSPSSMLALQCTTPFRWDEKSMCIWLRFQNYFIDYLLPQ